jgi:hypothetical protein
MWARGDFPDPSEHGEPVHAAGRFAGGNIAWARGEIPDANEHGDPVRRGGLPSMPRAWARGDLPSPDEIVANAEEWRKKEPASRGQLVYVNHNGKRVAGEYHSMTPEGKLRISLREGDVDFDPADVEIWRNRHLGGNPRRITNARFSTRKSLSLDDDDDFLNASALAEVIKVGPHGYTHGWVFHGTPGSQEHADFLSSSADAIHASVGDSPLAKPVHDVLKGAASSIQNGDIRGARKQLDAAALAAHQVAERGGDPPIPGMEHPARNVAFVLNYHSDLLNGAQLAGRSSQLPDRPEAQVTAKKLVHGLASGIAKEKAPGEGAMGETKMVTFNDGSRWVRKKDSMISQDREVLSSRVSDALGANAPEVIFEPGWKPGDVNPVIWEPMLPGTPAVEKEALEGDNANLDKYYDTPNGKRIGLLDAVTSNIDRNKGNWLIGPDNRAVPIDHGESLYNGWKPESQFSQQLSGGSFTPQEWDNFQSNLADLQPDFAALGHEDWHNQMMNTLAQVRAS